MYYDEEVLDVLEGLENFDKICIALVTGGGKSQSILEFVRRNNDKRHLLIFGTMKEQISFFEELGEDICAYWNGKLEESFSSKFNNFENGAFCITKQKFINLIINCELEILNSFEYIFYDEFGSLNPCIVEDLVTNLSDIQKYSKKVFTTHDRELYDNLDFIYRDINIRAFKSICIDSSDNKLFNRVFKLECTEQYKNIAKELLDNMRTPQDEKTSPKTNINIHYSIKLMLHSILNNELYISAYEGTSGIVYNILGVNNLIRDFIEQFMGKLIVMDATAELVRDVYKYLGIEIISDFTKNKNKTYEHVNIKLFDVEDVTPRDIRSGKKEILDKISQVIKSRKVITFVPLKIEETIKRFYGFDFGQVYHFRSGDDVGSNQFKDETELNIVALQTYPKVQRTLYNHIIKGMTLEQANSTRNDLAEFELLSSHLVQNINRSKSRIYSSNDEININLICVNNRIAKEASLFMKGSKYSEETKIYKEGFKDSERALKCLEEYLKSFNSEKDVVELDNFLINRNFYSNLNDMKTYIENNKKDIMYIAFKYGFYLKIEEGRPYLIKIENKFTEDEFLKLDTTKDKVFKNLITIKNEIDEISIKDLKLKLNITTPTFSRMWKKHEKDFEGFGIYRIGNSIIFRKNGYN